jgi:protein-disulfide isomerase
MDAERFGRCVDSGKYEAAIKADVAAGDHAGVTGTPALFVNGRPVPGGAVEYDVLAKVIDEELKRVARD